MAYRTDLLIIIVIFIVIFLVILCTFTIVCRILCFKLNGRSAESHNHRPDASRNVHLWQVPITENGVNLRPAGHDISGHDTTTSVASPANYELSAPPDYDTAIRQCPSTGETNRTCDTQCNPNDSNTSGRKKSQHIDFMRTDSLPSYEDAGRHTLRTWI